ncbi:hypothetical protein G6O69_04165 [Pseudenhygromyxa sp. WMMC2535]|uniref:hypothetical protein n=1 Tax=Pseudenhygromyxa sp. WMMC2535 TaxID=2712867 RepID=UPI00155438C5|nr:hypothetical protein [Pseudenhygromyxa sp. WMMC2535]NVB37012.1 hypothetical protein [Pseudenhygromyxa sp. WMMC2535]
MQSISDPLNALHEDGSWFARAHELRLWLVRCDANLRKPVIDLLPKFEFHHDNRSAWPLLLDAHTHEDGGWQLRANNLAADWQRRVEAFAQDGVEQGNAWAQQGLGDELADFRATATLIAQVMAPPLDGLVLVLAPTIVEDGAALEADLMALLAEPDLARCRWILVLDVDVEPPRALLDALGQDYAQTTICVVDPDAQRRDLAAMLGGSDPKHFGAAWPVGVTPPPRVDDPPPLPKPARDQALREAGIDPAMLDGAPQLRDASLRAALAMQEGRGAEAIAHQRRACQLCASLGQVDLQLITQTSLAAYLSGLGQRAAAKQVLDETVGLAREKGLRRGESQALLALGLIHNLDQDHAASTQAYVASAQAAEAGGEPELAIEGWRMAGTLAASLRQDQAAVDAFAQALRIAGATEPERVAASGAPEAARSLATVYERHQMPAQAASLHALADSMENQESGESQESQALADAEEASSG